MNISLSDALPLFTNDIVAKFSDHQRPKSFGRSFFTEVETATKLASMLSQRGLNAIATDVARGSRGNLNVFDKATQNIVYPPYFNEIINITEFDSYDYLFTNSPIASDIAWGVFMDEVAKRMEFCMDKIDRRYEYQCWQLLLTGKITLNNGQPISYGRKAASIFAPGGGSVWSNDTVDPFDTFARGAKYLNETGKMAGNTVRIIFAPDTFAAYTKNKKVTDRNLFFNNNLDVIATTAVRDSTGKTFLGRTTVGSFNYEFYTYNDFYQDDDGTVHSYLTPGWVTMVPETTMNTLTYCAVPQLLQPGQMPVKGKFKVWDAIDVFQEAHFMGVKSAGIPMLGAVDQVYNEKVL